MIIKLVVIISCLLLLTPIKTAFAGSYYNLCQYEWKNIENQTCRSYSVVNKTNACNGQFSYCTDFSNYDPQVICYRQAFENNKIIFNDYIKAGTLEVKVEEYYEDTYIPEMEPDEDAINYNEFSQFSENFKNIGCGVIDSDNNQECDSLYEILFNKLSTKFPLDIFVPAYNFDSSETACPEVTLFGHTLEFCAITMVGKSVKYIFLISFIIRSLMSF